VTSLRDVFTSSVCASSDETSVTRPRYAAISTTDVRHCEQISIISAAVAESPTSTISGNGTRLRPRTRLHSFTSTSFMSEDRTKHIVQVSFMIGVENPDITSNVSGQTASVPERVKRTSQQSLPFDDADSKAHTSDNHLPVTARDVAVNKEEESSVAEDELVVPVARAQRERLNREQCLPIFGDHADTFQPERHSSTFSLSSESEGNSELENGNDSKVSSDEENVDSHLDEGTVQEVEAPLVQRETRSAKHQIRHENLSEALRSMGVVTSEEFFSGDNGAAEEDELVVPVARAQKKQLDKEKCLHIFGDFMDIFEPERHSGTSSLSSQSEENSELEDENDPRLGSKVSSDEDSHYDKSTLQEVEAPLVQRETRSAKHQMKHENLSKALRSMGVVTSEEFPPGDDEGRAQIADADGEQPNEEKCSGVFSKYVDESSKRRHLRTSSHSSTSSENSHEDQQEQVEKSQASRLLSQPQTNKETSDPHSEQNLSQKVDEPDLVQRETQSSRNKSRNEGVSNALKSIAFPTSEEFPLYHHVAHNDGKQSDAEECIFNKDVNKISHGRHSRTSSISSSSDDSSQLEEKEEKEKEFKSGSKPSKETLDSQNISQYGNFAIVNEPALVQQETKKTKNRTRHEQVSNALKFIEPHPSDKFNSHDHVENHNEEQLNVNEITRGEHVRTLSSSSDSEIHSQQKAEEKGEEDEEEEQEVGKTEAFRLRSPPSSNLQTPDSHPEKSILHKVEPALLQNKTRSTIQRIENDKESCALRSMEEFTFPDHKVNTYAEIPPESRSRTLSNSSSNSENNLQLNVKEKGEKEKKEIGKIQAMRLYSVPPTNRETFDSHPELNTSQKAEHDLVQRETRNTKQRTKLEEVSRALRSAGFVVPAEFTFYDHGDGEHVDTEKCSPIFVQDVHQFPPGRHSSTSSSSSSSSSEDDLELEENESNFRRVANHEDANEYNKAVDEEAVVKSDPVTKQRQPAVNASLGELQSGQLSDVEVIKNNENYSPMSTSKNCSGVWAMQSKSTEKSPYFYSSRPGNRLFSAERPYFYATKYHPGQFTSDHRSELMNAEFNGDSRYDTTLESEVSSQNTRTPENQHSRLLFTSKENLDVQQSSTLYRSAKSIVTRGEPETGSWKSSESTTGLEALSDIQNYNDGGFSTQLNALRGLEQKTDEDIRLYDGGQLDVDPYPTLFPIVNAAVAETFRPDNAGIHDSGVPEDELSRSRHNDNYQSKMIDTGCAPETVFEARNKSDVVETVAGECDDDPMMRPDYKQQSPSSETSSRAASDRSEQQKRRSSKLRWLRDASADENETLSKVAGNIWQRAGGRTASQSNHRQRAGTANLNAV